LGPLLLHPGNRATTGYPVKALSHFLLGLHQAGTRQHQDRVRGREPLEHLTVIQIGKAGADPGRRGTSVPLHEDDVARRRGSGAAGPRGSQATRGTFLGLNPEDVQRQLAAARRGDSAGRASLGASPAAGASRAAGGDGGARNPRGRPLRGGGQYVVFVTRNGQPTPTWIRTGLTDLDYSEVLQGLSSGDSVLVLPSASLVQSQQEMRERFTRVTGGGAIPGMQQQQQQQGTQPSGSGRP